MTQTSKNCNESWIKSTFFDSINAKEKAQSYPSNNKLNSNAYLWDFKYIPKTRADLAVHKKKIQEVELILELFFSGSDRCSDFLLLTGPSGSGKSVTLKILAEHIGCEIQEWTNPQIYSNYNSESFHNKTDFTIEQSHLSRFQDFLLRANKYPSLQNLNCHFKHKLILIEEYPNIFFKEPSLFHNILRSYKLSKNCPVVFIVTDNSSGDQIDHPLFPKNFQLELNFYTVSFNPLAYTSLIKALNGIMTEEAKQFSDFQIPDKKTVESIALSCSGDMRAALNALQFISCKKNKKEYFTSSSSKRKTHTSDPKSTIKRSKCKKYESSIENCLTSVGSKDNSLYLFRALGKILYCKRKGENQEIEESLPSHLKRHYRDPLVPNPEEVLEKSSCSEEFFVTYLHQNYIDFFSDLDDLVRASRYFSDSDFLTADWSISSLLRPYAGSVATRAVLFCNSAYASAEHVKSNKKWKPLHKPMHFSVQRQYKSNCTTAGSLFKDTFSTPIELQTQILPYSLINGHDSYNLEQKSFLEEITIFPTTTNKHKRKSFSENGVNFMKPIFSGEDVLETHSNPKSCNLENNIELSTEQDVVINDFEDNW